MHTMMNIIKWKCKSDSNGIDLNKTILIWNGFDCVQINTQLQSMLRIKTRKCTNYDETTQKNSPGYHTKGKTIALFDRFP